MKIKTKTNTETNSKSRNINYIRVDIKWTEPAYCLYIYTICIQYTCTVARTKIILSFSFRIYGIVWFDWLHRRRWWEFENEWFSNANTQSLVRCGPFSNDISCWKTSLQKGILDTVNMKLVQSIYCYFSKRFWKRHLKP